MFAGYGWHLAGRLAERWQQVPSPMRQALEGAVRTLVPSSPDRRSRATRAARFLAGASRPRPQQYRAWLSVFSEDLKRELYSSSMGPFPDRLACVFAATGDLDGLDAMLAADVAWYLPTDLLVKMDIATMANSLEARSPFLDKDLAEFAATLPSHFKLRGRESKYILKRALAEWVPAENMYRTKQGFAVPIAVWLRGDLRDFVSDHLLGTRFSARGLFNPDVVRRLVTDHQEGRADYAHHLWTLLMLELWFREFIDGTAI
jgi:asparagine synthase (glutamine-hydrolysing)